MKLAVSNVLTFLIFVVSMVITTVHGSSPVSNKLKRDENKDEHKKINLRTRYDNLRHLDEEEDDEFGDDEFGDDEFGDDEFGDDELGDDDEDDDVYELAPKKSDRYGYRHRYGDRDGYRYRRGYWWRHRRYRYYPRSYWRRHRWGGWNRWN